MEDNEIHLVGLMRVEVQRRRNERTEVEGEKVEWEESGDVSENACLVQCAMLAHTEH